MSRAWAKFSTAGVSNGGAHKHTCRGRRNDGAQEPSWTAKLLAKWAETASLNAPVALMVELADTLL